MSYGLKLSWTTWWIRWSMSIGSEKSVSLSELANVGDQSGSASDSEQYQFLCIKFDGAFSTLHNLSNESHHALLITYLTVYLLLLASNWKPRKRNLRYFFHAPMLSITQSCLPRLGQFDWCLSLRIKEVLTHDEILLSFSRDWWLMWWSDICTSLW